MSSQLGGAASHAQSNPARAPVANPLTAADLAPFIDGIVKPGMAKGKIAGGVVVIVRGGNIVFAKGYGNADSASGKPVRPDRTLFRIASISKTFTAIAVMQLVEHGKLDLDVDIGKYLDFKLPRGRYSAPLTLRHLLTHTAGFEDSFRELVLSDPRRFRLLADHVRLNIPGLVNPPGKVMAYSNYGSALAGYIVERASRTPFDVYVRNNILMPLGMEGSSAAQPLPASFERNVSLGYSDSSGPPGPFELIQDAPAGSISASGFDMARYMAAVLRRGRGPEPQLLWPDTFATMLSPQYRPHPAMAGIGLGFFVERNHGLRLAWHNGGTNYFLSNMHLILDHGIGVFASFNSIGTGPTGDSIEAAIWDGFLDRYFPIAPPVLGKPLATAQAHGRLMAGSYLSERRVQTSFAALGNLIGSLDIASEADGTLQFLTEPDGKPSRWQEISPFLWQRVGGEERLNGELDSAGRIIGINYQTSHFDRVRGLDNPAIARPLVVGSLAILIIATLVWFVRAGLGMRSRRSPLARRPNNSRVWLLGRLAIVAGVAGALALIYVVQGIGDPNGAALADNRVVTDILVVATLLLVPGAFMVWIALARWWKDRSVSRLSLAATFVVALAASILSVLLWRFSVFSFSLAA